jgi:tRNA G46 methylase TrmB
MLSSVSRADVPQLPGRLHHNVGEITMVGVSRLLKAFGFITIRDVFLDVGAGVGNVVLQAALQSEFEMAIGIEMQTRLTNLTETIIESHRQSDHRLNKILVVNAGITTFDARSVPALLKTTHLFTHNTVFLTRAVLALEELFWLPNLRFIS